MPTPLGVRLDQPATLVAPDRLDLQAARLARLGEVLIAPRHDQIAAGLAELPTVHLAAPVFELADARLLTEAQARLLHVGLQQISDAGSHQLSTNLTVMRSGLITSSSAALRNVVAPASLIAGLQAATVPDWPQTESVLILDELDMTNKTMSIVVGAVSHMFIIVRRLTAASGARITYVPLAQDAVGAPGLHGLPDPADPSYDRTARIGEGANEPSADGGAGVPGGDGGTGPAGLDAPDLTIVALQIDAMPDIVLPGQRGGTGGPGGSGGAGGDGQRGRDCHSTWVDCRHGPGRGGAGGRGGNGGRGGHGGPGGQGGTVTITTQESCLQQVVTARRFILDLGGGMGGSPGQQGEPGPGGRGGQDGYAYGRCDSRPDRAGANGERGDKTGDLGVGTPGGPGDMGFSTITVEQWNRLLAKPWLVSIDPVSGFAGSSVIVKGVNLTPGLSGRWQLPVQPPVTLPTTFNHSGQVTVRIPDSTDGGRGSLVLTDGAVTTNEIPFSVRPQLISLAAADPQVYAGAEVRIRCSAVQPGATVTNRGSAVPTTVVARDQVSISLPPVIGLDPGEVMELILTNPDGLASDIMELTRLPQLDSGFRAKSAGFAFANFTKGQHIGLDTYTATFGTDEVAFETLLDPRVTGLFYAFYNWYLANHGHCTALSCLALENFHQHRPALFAQGPSSTDDPPPLPDELMERINRVQGRVISRDLVAYYAKQSEAGLSRVEATVRDIEATLTAPARLVDARVMCFIPVGGVWDIITDPQERKALSDSHCVVPARIQYADARRDLDGARLYIYDNNHPGDDTRYVSLARKDGSLHFTYEGYSFDAGYTLGTARLQEQLYDDVDVPFAEIEAGLLTAGFLVDLVLSPAAVSVRDTSGRILGCVDGKLHIDPALGWVRPGLENYLLIRADSDIEERTITGTADGTYSYASLHPGGRSVALTDVACSAGVSDVLHVAKDGSRVSLAAGTDKRVQLHVAAVIGGDVRSLSIEVDAVAKQELRLDLGSAVDAVALTGPAGRSVNVTARLARKGNVVETRTGTGALSAAGALSLPGHLWSDLSKLDALTGGSTSHRSYIVKPGDTLWSIAQATYGDGTRWRDIARLNLIDKPEQLRAGSVISLP